MVFSHFRRHVDAGSGEMAGSRRFDQRGSWPRAVLRAPIVRLVSPGTKFAGTRFSADDVNHFTTEPGPLAYVDALPPRTAEDSRRGAIALLSNFAKGSQNGIEPPYNTHFSRGRMARPREYDRSDHARTHFRCLDSVCPTVAHVARAPTGATGIIADVTARLRRLARAAGPDR